MESFGNKTQAHKCSSIVGRTWPCMKLLTLLFVSISLITIRPIIKFAQSQPLSIGHLFMQDRAASMVDRNLINFLDYEIDRSMTGTFCSDQVDFSTRVDYLAQRLDNSATLTPYGEQLLDGLQAAINFNELVTPPQKYKSLSLKSRGLADFLEEDLYNPYVLHNMQAHNIDKTFKEFETITKRMPRRERALLLESIANASEDGGLEGVYTISQSSLRKELRRFKRQIEQSEQVNEDLNNENNKNLERAYHTNMEKQDESMQQSVLIKGSKVFLNIISSIVKFGATIFDYLYMAPEFLIDMPIIGEKIVRLREKGEPIYKIVEMVRHTHYLYKLTSVASINELDMGDVVNAARAKKMISEAGIEAIKRLAVKMSQKYIKTQLAEDDMHEFVSRTSHCILSVLLPRTISCRLNEIDEMAKRANSRQ